MKKPHVNPADQKPLPPAFAKMLHRQRETPKADKVKGRPDAFSQARDSRDLGENRGTRQAQPAGHAPLL